MISIDALAQGSRLKSVNPMLKFIAVICLMTVCVASGNALVGPCIVAIMLLLVVLAGGLRLRDYLRFMTLPVSFLLAGGVALLFEVAPDPMGLLSFKVLGFWLCVSAESLARAVLVISRALGAVSCLCSLSLTTPMSDIIAVLRRLRCPRLIIDLMYLIYRYIFILLSLHRDMHSAARSRLGFRDYATSLRSTGKIYANLLACSYRLAGRNFDAMESRCFDGGIRFLERW